jgi:hypothetical protein
MNPMERIDAPGQRALESQRKMIVTSCDEGYDVNASATTPPSISESESVVPDYLFDDQADDEDEAYVYRYWCSGASTTADFEERT